MTDKEKTTLLRDMIVRKHGKVRFNINADILNKDKEKIKEEVLEEWKKLKMNKKALEESVKYYGELLDLAIEKAFALKDREIEELKKEIRIQEELAISKCEEIELLLKILEERRC